MEKANFFSFKRKKNSICLMVERYLEASEFQSFKKSRCGLEGVRGKQSGFPHGGAVARNNEQPHSTEAEMVSPLTEARSARIGSDSDRQRGVSPYESNPPKADYFIIAG